MGQTTEKKQKTSGKTAQRFNDIQFVQYELSSDEKAACKAWLSGVDGVDDVLLKFCDAGYSISVKWDDYSKAFAAFAQIRQPGHANAGMMLTGRGSTPFKAIKQALFKHFMVFDEQWAVYAENREAYDLDD